MSKQNLKQMVISVLKQIPKARNSDQYLTIVIWNNYYKSRIMDTSYGKAVLLKDIMELPREDNVKRIRALLNSKGLYLPTDEKVAMQRKLNMDQWREFINREAVSKE